MLYFFTAEQKRIYSKLHAA